MTPTRDWHNAIEFQRGRKPWCRRLKVTTDRRERDLKARAYAERYRQALNITWVGEDEVEYWHQRSLMLEEQRASDQKGATLRTIVVAILGAVILCSFYILGRVW